MSSPWCDAGWLCVGYSHDERAAVHLAVGDPDDWRPAYLSWSRGMRVAQVRRPQLAGQQPIWLIVNGTVVETARATL